MGQRHPLASNSALESTIDKILTNTEHDILANIKTGLDESQQSLDDAIPKLESEYDKIISDGKEAIEYDTNIHWVLELFTFNFNVDRRAKIFVIIRFELLNDKLGCEASISINRATSSA